MFVSHFVPLLAVSRRFAHDLCKHGTRISIGPNSFLLSASPWLCVRFSSPGTVAGRSGDSRPDNGVVARRMCDLRINDRNGRRHSTPAGHDVAFTGVGQGDKLEGTGPVAQWQSRGLINMVTRRGKLVVEKAVKFGETYVLGLPRIRQSRAKQRGRRYLCPCLLGVCRDLTAAALTDSKPRVMRKSGPGGNVRVAESLGCRFEPCRAHSIPIPDVGWSRDRPTGIAASFHGLAGRPSQDTVAIPTASKATRYPAR